MACHGINNKILLNNKNFWDKFWYSRRKIIEINFRDTVVKCFQLKDFLSVQAVFDLNLSNDSLIIHLNGIIKI